MHTSHTSMPTDVEDKAKAGRNCRPLAANYPRFLSHLLVGLNFPCAFLVCRFPAFFAADNLLFGFHNSLYRRDQRPQITAGTFVTSQHLIGIQIDYILVTHNTVSKPVAMICTLATN